MHECGAITSLQCHSESAGERILKIGRYFSEVVHKSRSIVSPFLTHCILIVANIRKQNTEYIQRNCHQENITKV